MADRVVEQQPKDNNYETFVAGILRDFESRLVAIQTSAELNMTAYENHCSELKRQLEASQKECDKLREALRSKTTRVVQEDDETVQPNGGVGEVKHLLQSMTSLSVKLQSSDSKEKVYECKVLDGILKGQYFTLVLNMTSWEYTYEPQGESARLERISPNFANSFAFPDYMLSRFLTNLLTANFGKSQTENSQT